MTGMWMHHPCVVFFLSAIGCLLLGPGVIRSLATRRWKQPFRHEDCPPLQRLHQQKQGTPTMGGLLVLGVAVAVAAAFGGCAQREGWLVMLAIAVLGGVGFADDLLKLTRANAGGLPKRPKLLLALALGAAIGGLTAHPSLGYRDLAIPWMAQRLDPGALWIPLAMMAIAGCAHAVNLTDGMDGLASGLLVVAFGAFGLLAFPQSSPQFHAFGGPIVIWCASLAGACVGFLWFNSCPASVFKNTVRLPGLDQFHGPISKAGYTCDRCYAGKGNYKYPNMAVKHMALLSWTEQALDAGTFASQIVEAIRWMQQPETREVAAGRRWHRLPHVLGRRPARRGPPRDRGLVPRPLNALILGVSRVLIRPARPSFLCWNGAGGGCTLRAWSPSAGRAPMPTFAAAPRRKRLPSRRVPIPPCSIPASPRLRSTSA